jgi:AraC family transcriptional regulator of adaptative response / DNA-3-methyladenine glycosylase II
MDLDPEDLDGDACYRAIQTRDARFDGRMLTAVRTTGIYCRPICPARTPKRENVSFYPTAAAAQEAGYRPCLRCRPETSPDLGAWRGTSNTVSRALGLIEDGALDDDDVEALADRAGVGERQLRRLFQQHLGATPIAVAQTRRVLLAKQLIHETGLPMAQVAEAAGFGSVRRFNETFQQLFGRPPLSLRRARSATSGPNLQAQALKVRLPYKPPYDWETMLGFLAVRAIPGVEFTQARHYARTISLSGDVGFITVEPGGADRLDVTVQFPNLRLLPNILARVRRVFDLAADPQLIGEHLSTDPHLATLVAARPGLRAPGAWDAFELAVRAVLGQQITVGGAIVIAGKLTAAYGEPVPAALGAPEGLTHIFPTPQRLAGADIAGHGLMPGARARAIQGLAAAAVADPLILSPRRGLESAIVQLKALPGIGEWTAQYIALRELREPDAFPAADIGLMRALADADGVRPTAPQLLARAEAWRPWRAYAAQHLWAADPMPPKSLKPKPTGDVRHAA